ncbi:MAG: hypothetical protein GF364_17490 [Candidatus Lokiarchaeota archaeon]|nr:hypothetical protein [Candidatus Lokiarchaeota archaeon]
MAIYETGVILNGSILFDKKYYSTEHELDNTFKGGILHAVNGFAHDAFDTEFNSFTLASYKFIAISTELDVPNGIKKKQEGLSKHCLMMFSVIEKTTDENAVRKCMREALVQFMNRYSVNDILSKNTKKFKKFNKRVDKVFGDLMLRADDQFAAIF